MPTIRSSRWITVLLMAMSIVSGRVAVAAGPANAIGYEIELDSLPSPHPRPGDTAPAPAAGPETAGPSAPYVKVGIPWAQVEKTAQQYDWSVVDEIVLSHAQAGYAVVLQPRGDDPLYPPLATRDPAAVDAWTGFLRALAARYKDQVEHYALAFTSPELPARDAAYLLKLSSVMLQSADPGAKVVLWGLDASRTGAASYLEALYAEEIAAYVDTLAVTGVIGAVGAGEMGAIKAQMQLHDAGARLWIEGAAVPGGAAEAGKLLRGYLEGLQQEAALCFFGLDFGPEGKPLLLPALERIRQRFLPGYTPLVESGRGLQFTTSMGQPVSVRTVRLFDADEKKVLVAYDAGEGTQRGAQAVMTIDTIDLADPRLEDVAAGEAAPLSAYQKDDKAGLTRAAVPLADYPLVLEYRRFTTPLFGESEKLQVTEARLPSVEEILARHQAVQAAQDSLLANMRADARVDYHFRMGSGSALDINVTVMNAFYLDPKVGGEFEQKEFFVNGVKWRSDRLPEFPLPQPEKVMTLPLDISFDKRYAYTLAGEDTVGGYDCWVVDFEPLETTANLYKGRVWIDKKGFARVQISSVQTGLKPPIISNDEKDSYRPVKGPDGLDYWLLARIDGQQVYSTAGRNLVLVREVTFTNHVINDTAFEDVRGQAYASDHQILRDTPAGQRYLEKTPGGGREIREDLNRDYLFLAGGVFYNRALDFPVPLAGANYFNRDLFGKGIQANVFYGGVLLFGNISEPNLFGTKMDASADIFAQGFSVTDTPVSRGREVRESSVDLTAQSVTLGLGVPFAEYWKIKLSGDLTYQVAARDEDTRSFLIPADTFITTLGLQGEFNRRAWNVTGLFETSRRSQWECWEICDPNEPGFIPRDLDDEKTYLRYQGSVTKDFFLPLNQKVHAGVMAFGGSDLDRFSQYKFGFFGNRLRGFSGTGFGYTNGGKAQLQYAFNLGDIVRFDATIDHARVRDRAAIDDEYKSFTGFGLSGQTIIPGNLIVSLDWGIAVASDIDEFKRDQEIFLTVLRLFH